MQDDRVNVYIKWVKKIIDMKKALDFRYPEM